MVQMRYIGVQCALQNGILYTTEGSTGYVMSSGAHKVYQTNGNVCREYCPRTTTVLFSLGYIDYSVLTSICMSFTL